MAFSGFPFLLCFLPVALCGVAVFGRLGSEWVKFWLIAMSLVFYSAGASTFVPLLILSVTGNFILIHLMPGRVGQAFGRGLAPGSTSRFSRASRS